MQALPCLKDLRLRLSEPFHVNASPFSGMQGLTRLEAPGFTLEAGVLAGTTQLRHLALPSCRMRERAAGVAQLLCQLQGLQHLTFLNLRDSLAHQADPPASAYSALTANSKLQHLNVSFCTLPAGAWQLLLPAGRQLPHLTSLNIIGGAPSRAAATRGGG